MKRIIIFLIGILLAVTLTAQNKYTYPIYVGKVTVSTGKIFLYGITSGTLELRPSATAGTGTVFQFPSSNGANGNVLTTNGSGVTSWAAAGTGTIDTTFIYAEIDSLEQRIDSLEQRLTDIENDTIEGSSLYPELADSTYSYPYGIGGTGVISDTALFQNNALAGYFYNERDTLVATDLWGVLKSGTGTETLTIQCSWDVNFLDGTPTVLNTSAFTINDIEGNPGDHDTSFNNPKIPPNRWVWFTVAGLTANNKPTILAGTLTFYRIPSH